LRAFVEQPVPPLPAPYAAALRERVVGRMEAQRASAGAHVGPARVRPWLLLAAACLPFLIWVAVRGASHRTERAGVATLTDLAGRAAVVGDEVTTGPGDTVRAGLPSGAVVDVGESSRARFAASSSAEGRGERIELGVGRVQVSVPKLSAGRDLRVHTAQATVVVHGTKFTVEARPGETRVSVTEGVVEVDGPAEVRMLTAGMSFVVSDAADKVTLAAPTQETPADAPAEPTAARRTDGASTLAAENALLAEAMRLRREKHEDRALARLDELIARHAGSPLLETARVERMRALADLANEPRLAREARSYLADYPTGFARAEVSRLLESAQGHGP
jgi:hypothetical protein